MGADGTEIGGTGRLGRYRPRSGSEPIERLSRNSGGPGWCAMSGPRSEVKWT